jgi:S-adenosylmethionine:tRNA ribosyltransferase-isomerase
MIGGASKWKPGQILQKKLALDKHEVQLQARYVGKSVDQFIIEFTWNSDHHFAEVLHAAGAIPLPPYIKRKAALTDADRYQTVFAQHRGSVAAPTAALHFTPSTFEALKNKKIHTCNVTLHVGAGTFKPVKTETIADHSMHGEYFTVSANTIKKLIEAEVIIAVGTTSLRTLESLHWIGIKIRNGATELNLGQWESMHLSQQDISYKESLECILEYLEKNELDSISCTTSLLIMPGYRFHSAQALVTNFHQPKSTLLLLIAAFIGEDWKRVYNHALQNNYRFLSYGDSSLLWRH